MRETGRDGNGLISLDGTCLELPIRLKLDREDIVLIRDRVTAMSDTFTPAEQRLVQELWSHPRDAALGTASELAARIGVHEATASRLAKKLGFSSYATFRDALRQEFIPTADPATRLRNTLSSSRGQSLIGRLVDQEMAGLGQLPTYVSDERLALAAEALSKARKVFVFARGNAGALAVMMERRLKRMGIDATLLSGDSRDLAEGLAAMTGADALLAFAFRRTPRAYGLLVQHCRNLGAASVCVSDLAALSPAADHALFAPRAGSDDDFQTLTVPMAIANALILQMAEADGERALRRLEQVGALIEKFDEI